MKKNNKNLIRVKAIAVNEIRLNFLISCFLLILIVFWSVISQAQENVFDDELTLQVTEITVQLEGLTEESALIESAIGFHASQVQDMQAELDSANAGLTGLQNQRKDLGASIVSVENSIQILSVQKNQLNIAIDDLEQSRIQLAQQRIEVNDASTVKATQLNAELSLAQQKLNRVQILGAELIGQFDARITLLNQYLLRVNSDRLTSYIERYIQLIETIKRRYVVIIENSTLIYTQQVSQTQEEIEQLNTETSLLLATIDTEVSNANVGIIAHQQEVQSLQSQIAALQGQNINLESELVSIATLIIEIEEQITQLSGAIETVSLAKMELINDSETLFEQIEILLVELTQLERELLAQQNEEAAANAVTSLSNLELTNVGRCQANAPDVIVVACFNSDKEQIVRISHAQLIELGVDLSGVPKNNIGVLSDGDAIPTFVSADELFDESSFIEIVTNGNDDSIYSNNVGYLIYVDFTEEFALSAVSNDVVNNDARILSLRQADINTISNNYTEEFHYEQDDIYNVSGLSDFGWTDSHGFHYIYSGQTRTVDVVFELNAEAQLDHFANLLVKYAKLASSADSVKTIVSLNGLPLGSEHTDQPGSNDTQLEFEIAPGVLRLGENTFSLTVTSLGSGRITFQFDEFTLSYQRHLAAKEDALIFSADSGQYIVDNFNLNNSENVVVFKHTEEGRIERSAPLSNVGMNASFSESTSDGFVLSTREAQLLSTDSIGSINSPFVLEANGATQFTIDAVNTNVELTLPRYYQDIISPDAEYLIISHADFIGTQAMSDLVSLRETEYTVQVVDVDQIYAQYSQGVFDANAIKEFIGDKMSQSSTKMVLLVGDDTYDYKNRLDLGEESFIPSLYLTSPRVMPADSVYVDQDGNQIPDIAIGRFPVETVEEFSNVVEKTVLFSQRVYPQHALLATNYTDGIGASHFQPILRSLFRSSWAITDILMTEDTVEARDSAMASLLDSLNESSGSGLMVYTGHNSHATGPMFTSFEIPLLANQGKPFTAILVDSFTGFYVSDQITDAIGVQAEGLLVADGIGAAAVFAPSSTVGFQSVQTRFAARVARNETYGEAYLVAMKASFAIGSASYNLLGDPGLRMNTF